MTIDFSQLLKEIEQGVIAAAVQDATAFAEQAAADAAKFIAASTASIAKYITLYANGQINGDELKSLLLGLGSLAEMQGLTEAGLAEVEIEKIRNAILSSLASIVGSAVGKIVSS